LTIPDTPPIGFSRPLKGKDKRERKQRRKEEGKGRKKGRSGDKKK
jgi:hypothetical protein